MNLVELKKAINSLSYSDKRELLEALERSAQSHSISNELGEQRFSKGIYCPHCGCVENIQKFGKSNSKQRYRCKDCGRTFSTTSESVLSGTHKSLSAWERDIECMLDGLSIRKSAEECGISLQTSFVWRHKILDALSRMMEKETSLKGVIEADETFFRVSYKGRKKEMPRPSYRRGTKASKRGLSRQQVCVPCAIDRSNSVLSKICNLGKISTRELTAFYEGKVEVGAIFCTDSEKSYKGFTSSKEYKLVQIESGKHKKGIYHINHINAYHNNLKQFIYRFRGVATKYLNNYLVWNNCLKMGVGEVLSSVVKELYTVKYRLIGERSAVPVLIG